MLHEAHDPRAHAMQFRSAVSDALDAPAALDELLSRSADPDLGPPDLAVLFFTPHLKPRAAEIVSGVREVLRPRTLIGVTAEGVIGNDREIERRSGASLLAGWLPDVTLRPFHIARAEWARLLDDDERLQQRVGSGDEHRGQLVFADPFTTPVDEMLARFDEWLHAPTCGGMASGGGMPGSNLLVLNDTIYTEGAVGLGIGGPVRLETVVSQGCRPIGQPMVITRAEGHLVFELGRRPALEVAQSVLRGLSSDELTLVNEAGLFVGVVIDEYRDHFRRGDFLVRGLIGIDQQTHALVLGDDVRAGQTVQFHLRDAETAHEDLTELLRREVDAPAPSGALLFSCNGRGTRMFAEPGHDARTTRELLPDLPLAGFFAMGELGPVGGRSFIHGHTASFVLFHAPGR